MAGYKTTVKNDNPVSFHTFDLDTNLDHFAEIIDEMNSNGNPMYMVGDNYQLEYVSLNPIEPTDQHSIRIAEINKPLDEWSPVFGNIPHSVDYNMDTWSLEFIVKKAPAGQIRDVDEPGRYQDIYTPLIKKGSSIYVYYFDDYNGTDKFRVSLLNGTFLADHINTTEYPIWNTTNHYVITYGVDQIDVNEYKVTLKIYCNGRLTASHSIDYFDSPPNMISGDQWYIFGDGGTNPNVDYATEDLQFDQFAIYDYQLTDEQISNHYRKTKIYADLISLDRPEYYWRMNDTSLLNSTIQATVGGINGTYYNSHVKGQPGPEYIKDSLSTYFNNGGTGYIKHSDTLSRFIEMININADYSVEFWFQIDQNHKGVIFSCHEERPNYRGVTIYANSKFESENTGIIQCNESVTYQLHTPDGRNYTDGKWHHLVFKRSGTNLYLYLDGEIVDSMEANRLGTNTEPSQVHLMSLDPYVFTTDGSLSEVAIYDHSIQSIQINSHYHFSTRHKIFGFTLLEGQGVSSTVRFYDNITGEMVGETISDNTGEYTFYTYSNKQLDIVALLPDNITTRYRIHAPILPAEFDDEHL